MIWNDENVELLKKMYAQGAKCSDIASALNTTTGSVRNKAWRLGITYNNNYTEEEKEYIIANYKSYNLQEISEHLGRPKTGICRFAREQGLDRTCKKKELTKPKRKFASDEELKQYKSKLKKEWYKTHEHPRGMLGKHHSKEYCEEISKRVKEYWAEVTPEQLEVRYEKMIQTKIKNNTMNSNLTASNPYSRTKSGKRSDLNGQFFRSAWEANIARLFNAMKIKWEYEPKTFYFEKIRRGCTSYTPDFYLPEYDVWIEVKGWMDDKSRTKLKRFAKYYPNEKLELIDSKRYREIEKKAKILPYWE